MVAAEKGDFSLLKATLATFGAKSTGWEQMVALGEQAYTRITEATAATAATTAATVHEIAGGPEQWGEVQKWASANADADEKKAINAMLDAGGLQARAAANLLVNQFNSAPGTTKVPATATTANGGSPNDGVGPLSPRDYGAATRALAAKIGSGRMERSPEYAVLQSRLAAYNRG